jgi:hypothetical protein
MPMAQSTGFRFFAVPGPAIAGARQSRGQFLRDRRLDEAAHLRAQAVSIGSNQLSKRRPSASSARAGVVWLTMAWSPARRSNAGNQGGEPRRLRHPK